MVVVVVDRAVVVVVLVGVVSFVVATKGVVSSWTGFVSLISSTSSGFFVAFSVKIFFVDWMKRRVVVDRVVVNVALVPENIEKMTVIYAIY